MSDRTVDKRDYWRKRCEAAEKAIEMSPCDPDTTLDYWVAYKLWYEIRHQREPKEPPTDNGMLARINSAQQSLMETRSRIADLKERETILYVDDQMRSLTGVYWAKKGLNIIKP